MSVHAEQCIYTSKEKCRFVLEVAIQELENDLSVAFQTTGMKKLNDNSPAAIMNLHQLL